MEYRLKRQCHFDLLFKKGKRAYGKHLMILSFKKDSLKVGYSLSKKHGNAVTRNRIKRLLRASFNQYLPQIKSNYYIVILPKVEKEYSYNNYVSDLKYLLRKEKLISD